METPWRRRRGIGNMCCAPCPVSLHSTSVGSPKQTALQLKSGNA
uniref:Transmembrane O-methyltransferase n=1 Tax=Microcebus murinus TaxID=30608 RepID=A0A8C5Y981_MICMU